MAVPSIRRPVPAAMTFQPFLMRLHPLHTGPLRSRVISSLDGGSGGSVAPRRVGWDGDMFQQERDTRFRDHVAMTGTSVACLLKIGERAARNPSPASYACVVH